MCVVECVVCVVECVVCGGVWWSVLCVVECVVCVVECGVCVVECGGEKEVQTVKRLPLTYICMYM